MQSLGKKFCLGNSRSQIDLKARLHWSIKLCINQILNQINSSLSTLFPRWNTISDSYYTRKAQIYAKYSQHLPSITSAMAAGSKSRWSHVTFMARNEYHSRSSFFPTFAPVILHFITPFQFHQHPTSEKLRSGWQCYSLNNWLSKAKVNKMYLLLALAQS